MADISDVTAYFATTAANAVYPNGTSQPSVANMDVQIAEGWPLPEQLDLDLHAQQIGSPPGARTAGRRAHVSIYAPPGVGRPATYQIQDNTYVITPVSLGLTVIVSGNQITITGTPGTGEFVTIEADRQFVYSETGVSAAAILSALLTDVQVNYPAATVVGSTLTIPYNFSLIVRQGGQATLGRVIHRECQQVMVSVWAPDRVSRTALAEAIDVAIKSKIVAQMPDTSDVRIVYQRTSLADDYQNANLYRRDLYYDCEYATLLQFPGYTVTSANLTIGPNLLGQAQYAPSFATVNVGTTTLAITEDKSNSAHYVATSSYGANGSYILKLRYMSPGWDNRGLGVSIFDTTSKGPTVYVFLNGTTASQTTTPSGITLGTVSTSVEGNGFVDVTINFSYTNQNGVVPGLLFNFATILNSPPTIVSSYQGDSQSGIFIDSLSLFQTNTNFIA